MMMINVNYEHYKHYNRRYATGLHIKSPTLGSQARANQDADSFWRSEYRKVVREFLSLVVPIGSRRLNVHVPESDFDYVAAVHNTFRIWCLLKRLSAINYRLVSDHLHEPRVGLVAKRLKRSDPVGVYASSPKTGDIFWFKASVALPALTGDGYAVIEVGLHHKSVYNEIVRCYEDAQVLMLDEATNTEFVLLRKMGGHYKLKAWRYLGVPTNREIAASFCDNPRKKWHLKMAAEWTRYQNARSFGKTRLPPPPNWFAHHKEMINKWKR
jgi:hypothetical protein